jgi:hypothetical protein
MTKGRTGIHKIVINPIGLEARKVRIEKSTASTAATLVLAVDACVDTIK